MNWIKITPETVLPEKLEHGIFYEIDSFDILNNLLKKLPFHYSKNGADRMFKKGYTILTIRKTFNALSCPKLVMYKKEELL